jgi:hypothetical protein
VNSILVSDNESQPRQSRTRSQHDDSVAPAFRTTCPSSDAPTCHPLSQQQPTSHVRAKRNPFPSFLPFRVRRIQHRRAVATTGLHTSTPLPLTRPAPKVIPAAHRDRKAHTPGTTLSLSFLLLLHLSFAGGAGRFSLESSLHTPQRHRASTSPDQQNGDAGDGQLSGLKFCLIESEGKG